MNAYDFLLSLDRLDGQLIDETMDCLYPKERRGGRRVVRTLLIAAVLASLFTAAAFASDFLGFREAIIKPESIGRIPDFTVTHEDGSSETRDMSNSAGVSMTKPENAPESMQPWVENINTAAKEWSDYRREEWKRYLNEMLPNVGRFYDGSSTEEPEYVNNGDGTYTVKPVKQRIYKDPVTAPVIEYEDESSFFVISEEEYENITELSQIFYGGYYQSKYDWNYGAWDEASDAKLAEIAEKHGLRLRSGETELYWDERPIANGAPADRCFSPEELVRMLTERCCKGDFSKLFRQPLISSISSVPALSACAVSCRWRTARSYASTSATPSATNLPPVMRSAPSSRIIPSTSPAHAPPPTAQSCISHRAMRMHTYMPTLTAPSWS